MDQARNQKLSSWGKSLSDQLWENTEEIRQMALETDFVQGIKTGTLDPVKFGAFSVQDSIYLYKQQHGIEKAAAEARQYPNELVYLDYLTKRIKTYKTTYEEEFKKWHIRQPDGITLGDTLAEYTEYEDHVASTMKSPYFLVAICPCLKLWPWIGQQIADGDHGVYTGWAAENFDPNYDGYEKVDKLINNAYFQGIIEKETAMEIYMQCMKGEYNFFNSE